MGAAPRPRGFHHVAYACRDIRENHRFYADLMGFELIHTELHRHEEGFFTPVFEPDAEKALELLEALPGNAPDPI